MPTKCKGHFCPKCNRGWQWDNTLDSAHCKNAEEKVCPECKGNKVVTIYWDDFDYWAMKERQKNASRQSDASEVVSSKV